MKTIKDKQILMAADFAGYPIKEWRVMKLSQLTVLAAVALSVFGATAETCTFPSAGTDISSPTDWGREAIPATTDLVRFAPGKVDQKVTASSDVEFGSIQIDNASHTVWLDMRDAVSGGSPRKVKLNGSLYFDTSGDTKGYFQGGDWKLSEDVSLVKAEVYLTPQGSSLTIDSGAVVDCNRIFGGWGFKSDTPGKVNVTGEGTVVSTKVLRVGYFNGGNVRFTVSDKAKVCISGTGNGELSFDDGNGANNTLTVKTGAQLLLLSGRNACYQGRKGGSNVLAVETNSTFDLSVASCYYFGHFDNGDANGSHNNSIRVRGENAVCKLPAVYHGNANGVAASAGSGNNVVTVTDGASFSAQRYHFYGHDNGFDVSNATVRLCDCGIQCQTSTNCYLRLRGAHPSFVVEKSSGYSYYRNSFNFIFDLPPEGYDGTVKWPVCTTNAAASFDASVSVTINGCAEMLADLKAKHERRRVVNLAKFSPYFETGNGITTEHLNRWNAALPDYAKLSFSGSELTLTVRNKMGFIMIVQ